MMRVAKVASSGVFAFKGKGNFLYHSSTSLAGSLRMSFVMTYNSSGVLYFQFYQASALYFVYRLEMFLPDIN